MQLSCDQNYISDNYEFGHTQRLGTPKAGVNSFCLFSLFFQDEKYVVNTKGAEAGLQIFKRILFLKLYSEF